MIVSYKEFVGGVNKIKPFALDMKGDSSVLLNFSGSELHFCFYNGKQSISSKVEVSLEDGDIDKVAVVKLSNISELIELCNAPAGIETGDLTLTIDEQNINASTYKYTLYCEDEDSEEYSQKRVASVEKAIRYRGLDNDSSAKMLARMDYSAIFKGDSWDVWEKSKLMDILKRVSKNDAKTCYISGPERKAFSISADNSSLTVIPIDKEIQFGFTISSKVAKNVVEILSKVEDTDIRVRRDEGNTYCQIITDSEYTGMMFETMQMARMDYSMYSNYMAEEFNESQLVLNRVALDDMIKAVLRSDKPDECKVRFVENTIGELSMVVNKSGSSINKLNISVTCEAWKADDNGVLKNKEYNFNFRVLGNLLVNCYNTYVILETKAKSNAVATKLIDCTGKDDDGNIIESASHYTMHKE